MMMITREITIIGTRVRIRTRMKEIMMITRKPSILIIMVRRRRTRNQQ